MSHATLPRRRLILISAGLLTAAIAGCRSTDILNPDDGTSRAETTAALPMVNRLRQSRGLSSLSRSRPAEVAAIAQAVKQFGRIDILVNNAGITQAVKTLEITGADYDRILDVSLRGTLYMSQAALPAMRAQKSGSIVCISSVSAQRGGGILGGPHYSAAKAGVLGLARAMAREFGPESIRVNALAPGWMPEGWSRHCAPWCCATRPCAPAWCCAMA